MSVSRFDGSFVIIKCTVKLGNQYDNNRQKIFKACSFRELSVFFAFSEVKLVCYQNDVNDAR
jgi:hypothetical protein